MTPLRICILSRKDLSRVTRVVRQANALVEAGHEVTVVSLVKPMDELVESSPGVEYLEVKLEPWTRRLLIRYRRRRAALMKRATPAAKTPAAASAAAAPTARRATARPRHGLERLLLLALSVPSALLLRVRGEERFGDSVRELSGLDTIGLLQRYFRIFAQHANTTSFAAEAERLLQGRRFDFCQAHDNYALVAASRVAKATGARVVYDAVEISEHRIAVRADALSRIVARLERAQEARIFRRAEHMLTIGDGLADWYARRYGIERPVVVRNCRYLWHGPRRFDIREDCGLPDDARLVVWFGYAYPDQGLEAILEAAARTAPDVHFALLTAVLPRWEPFLAGLHERAEALGVADRVHFLPPRGPNELIGYVSGADVGIIPRPNVGPNVYFSMPNKFLEMVQARLPVAVSDLADMRTLVERHGIGAVFDVERPESVARTLEDMLRPPEADRLREAVDRAAAELCWENESRRYVAMFGNTPSER